MLNDNALSQYNIVCTYIFLLHLPLSRCFMLFIFSAFIETFSPHFSFVVLCDKNYINSHVVLPYQKSFTREYFEYAMLCILLFAVK